jgi:inner membrane protein
VIWGAWWLWAAAALVLGIVEVLAPGFFFLGFAIGAGAVAAMLLVGGPATAMITTSLPLLLVVFAVVSIVAWLVLRRAVGVWKGQVKTFDHDIND